MQVEKATHESFETELFMPVMKGSGGKYMAVLSDNSTDRDDESLSKGCIEKLGQDDGYLAALCNHKNDIFMMVAEWTNRGIQEVDGYTALVAEPKFYLSNPNAKTIKGMLDDGAKLGISIGAIVNDYDDVNGQRVFTDLELLEASFVAVPSNRHGRAMAIAKSFKKQMEATKVELTQKDIDSAVEKKVSEVKATFEKQLADKDAEISKLTADLKKSEEATAEAVENTEKAKSEMEEAKEKEAAAKVELEKYKSAALEKQQYTKATEEHDTVLEETEKAFKEGKLPIMNV